MFSTFIKTLIVLMLAVSAQNYQLNDTNVISAPQSQKNATVSEAKRIYVHSKTMFLKAATLEAAMRKHKEILQSGFVFTKVESDADVLIEIERAPFTTEFPYSIIDPKTHIVIGSGKVNSIGGTVAGKISTGFIKQMPSIDAAIRK